MAGLDDTRLHEYIASPGLGQAAGLCDPGVELPAPRQLQHQVQPHPRLQHLHAALRHIGPAG